MSRWAVTLVSLSLVAGAILPTQAAQAAPLPQDTETPEPVTQPAQATSTRWVTTVPTAGSPDGWVVDPDVAYAGANGTRIEVYSSKGDLGGGADYRPVNAYSRLVASVPLYYTEDESSSPTPDAISPDAVTPTPEDTSSASPSPEDTGSASPSPEDTSSASVTPDAVAPASAPESHVNQIYSTVFNSLQDKAIADQLPSGQWSVPPFSSKDGVAQAIYRPTAAYLAQINARIAAGVDARDSIHILADHKRLDDSLSSLGSLLQKALKNSQTSSTAVPNTSQDRLKGYQECWTAGDTTASSCLLKTTAEKYMHSKYAAFEQAQDSDGTLWDNVVWITSANLNSTSGGLKSNLSIAIYGDQKAYDAILDIYEAGAQRSFTTAYKAIVNANGITTDSGIKLYPSPRSTDSKGNVNGKDWEANFLASKVAVPGKSACKAYTVHSLFSTARQDILTNFDKLQKQGCSVKILLGTNALSDIVDTYFSMSVSLRNLINRVEFENVHDKSLTLSYTAGGQQYGWTWGGSANLNGTSLVFDELVFFAEDLTMTRAAEKQSERLYKLARAGAPTLSMPVYQSGSTKVVVTWGNGGTDIAGKVQLQYTTNGSSWKNYGKAFSTNSSGVARKTYEFPSSRVWRAKAGGKYSNWNLVTVKTKASSTTPRLYAPAVVKSGGTIPFLIAWKGKPTSPMYLQYKSGSKWKNYGVYYLNKGATTDRVGAISTVSRQWRVVTKKPSKVSPAITIKVKK